LLFRGAIAGYLKTSLSHPATTHIPSERSYTTKHVNEFEFRGDKIARRVTVADYALLRQIDADQKAKNA
jgi:hypothetical protein